MSYIDKLKSYYGDPTADHITFERKWMMLYSIPGAISEKIPNLPHRVYCNRDLVDPLEKTLQALIAAGLHAEIKTFDGCFCIRYQRASTVLSVHAFGLALDLNAHDNPFGHSREEDARANLQPFSDAFLQVWRDHGWVCGVDFGRGREDAMHFEFTKKFMTGL